MQNLEVKDTIQKIKKIKSETKKELEESIANGGRNENTDIQKKSKIVQQTKKMNQKLFKNSKKPSGIRKVTFYG